jgi:steroid 5-alpha reductase family enzyme
MSATVICLVVFAFVASSALMAFAASMQRRDGRWGWADVFWTFGTGLLGAALALVPAVSDSAPGRRWLVALLALLWALRLGSHILTRTLYGAPDARYAKLDREWGENARTRMFWFLQVQAASVALLALVMFAAAQAPRSAFDWRDVIGALILLVAIGGEALADRQIKRFAHDPANKGKVCDTGLWRYSRHPNYFFEWLGWLAYPIIGLGLTTYPWGLLTLLAPALMYWLLVHVSGIPPLEEHMRKTRPDAFAAYAARTSLFVPLPPKMDLT